MGPCGHGHPLIAATLSPVATPATADGRRRPRSPTRSRPTPRALDPRPRARGVRPAARVRRPTGRVTDVRIGEPPQPHQLHRRGARRLRPDVRARPQRPALPPRGRRAAGLPRREVAVPGLPRLARPRLRLRVRHLPPRVRGERQVLHRPHRDARRSRRADLPAASRYASALRAERGHRVDGRRPGGRHLQRHQPGAVPLPLRRPDPRDPADRLQPRPPSPATRTTACSTSPSATAGTA